MNKVKEIKEDKVAGNEKERCMEERMMCDGRKIKSRNEWGRKVKLREEGKEYHII